jgi:undecaprenyl-diphosphatase
MVYISDFNLWKIPLLIAGILLAIFGKFRERVFIILMLMALLIGDVGIVQGIRSVVNRPRPWQALNEVRYVDTNGVEIRNASTWEQGRSMPSGHVCNHTAAALLLTLLYGFRFWTPLLWLWLLLMSYSRIYTGAHYPSDILVSIPISLLYTSLLFISVELLWQKFGTKVNKKLFEKFPTLLTKSTA